jgi:hypothetical protein
MMVCCDVHRKTNEKSKISKPQSRRIKRSLNNYKESAKTTKNSCHIKMTATAPHNYNPNSQHSKQCSPHNSNSSKTPPPRFNTNSGCCSNNKTHVDSSKSGTQNSSVSLPHSPGNSNPNPQPSRNGINKKNTPSNSSKRKSKCWKMITTHFRTHWRLWTPPIITRDMRHGHPRKNMVSLPTHNWATSNKNTKSYLRLTKPSKAKTDIKNSNPKTSETNYGSSNKQSPSSSKKSKPSPAAWFLSSV